MRSGCCRYSFEKQPEGRSRISAKGVRASRCVPAETESPRKALVSARQRASQFPLRPYTGPIQPWQVEKRLTRSLCLVGRYVHARRSVKPPAGRGARLVFH